MAPKKQKVNSLPRVIFGKHAGEDVELLTLQLGRMKVLVSTFGATVTSITVPDCFGQARETVLGFDDHEPYENCPYFGCTVGRYCNRIAKGAFTLDGQTVTLTSTNDRGNHLHGGKVGWDRKIWAVHEHTSTSCTLSHTSPDGDEGYPGEVHAHVTMSLEWPSSLVLRYKATVSAPTPLNLTNHSYFNLSDGGATDMLDHDVRIFADAYLPTDPACIPTGEVRPVHGAMDLRGPVPLYRGIADGDGGNGYDHNYVIRDDPGLVDARGLKRAAWVRSPRTGIELNVLTTEPGIQICGANHLDGTCRGHGGRVYATQAGLCLETQKFPDSVNHAHFPSAIVRPDTEYTSTTVYAFSASAASTE